MFGKRGRKVTNQVLSKDLVRIIPDSIEEESYTSSKLSRYTPKFNSGVKQEPFEPSEMKNGRSSDFDEHNNNNDQGGILVNPTCNSSKPVSAGKTTTKPHLITNAPKVSEERTIRN
jgi:hypothetical protein